MAKFQTIMSILNVTMVVYCAPLHKRCHKQYGHKRDPIVTPGICRANGERAQMIIVWVRAPGVGNASHPQEQEVMRIKP